jgi:molybdate-binding protein
MAEYAAEHELDFVHLRQDEIDITARPGTSHQDTMADQLRRIRTAVCASAYGHTDVDFSDEMITP